MALHAAAPADTSRLLGEAAMWGFLHDLFRLPARAQWAWLCAERTHIGWRLLAKETGGCVPDTLPLAAGPAEYEEQYLAAFVVGMPEPLCPLIESHWNRRENVSRVLLENLLFYRQFGLSLRSSAKEAADYLLHQLEFLRYLALLGSDAAVRKDEDLAAQIALARTEYLARHPAAWIPVAADALEQKQPGTWPAWWMRLLALCCCRSGNHARV